MKLFDGGRAPNPRLVRVFLAEKGIEVPLEPVDMGSLGHKSEAVTERNPLQQLPLLELDDGTCISETIAICRYFEETNPEPPLMGVDATDKAVVEMWQRRVELRLFYMVANVFRHTHPAMKEWEVPQIAELAESSKPKVMKALKWFDEELATKPFIAGERFTIADITMMIAINFMKPAGLTVPEELTHLLEWYARVLSRPSAKA